MCSKEVGKVSGDDRDFKITWRAARVNKGYNQSEVAELSGKNIDTVVKYEKDSSNIPYDLMKLWIELYGVPSELIYCGPESDLTGKVS
jgi:transcriptional regulator with XRE-family HTH domain